MKTIIFVATLTCLFTSGCETNFEYKEQKPWRANPKLEPIKDYLNWSQANLDEE